MLFYFTNKPKLLAKYYFNSNKPFLTNVIYINVIVLSLSGIIILVMKFFQSTVGYRTWFHWNECKVERAKTHSTVSLKVEKSTRTHRRLPFLISIHRIFNLFDVHIPCYAQFRASTRQRGQRICANFSVLNSARVLWRRLRHACWSCVPVNPIFPQVLNCSKDKRPNNLIPIKLQISSLNYYPR